ncbi:hypothetical protein ACRWUW_26115, partial [Escherichia coli]
MTKTVSTSKKPRKQHSPEFRSEALKLAERIGVTAAARELSLYESQGTVAKLAMRQPFVLFKGLTFQKLCLPGAFRPG